MGILDKINKEKLAEIAKMAGDKTIEVSKIAGEMALEASKVAGMKAVEVSKVAGVKAVEVSKVAGVKALEVSKVAGAKALEVSKVAGVKAGEKAVEVSKIAGVKATEASKVAGVKAGEYSKIAGVKVVKYSKVAGVKTIKVSKIAGKKAVEASKVASEKAKENALLSKESKKATEGALIRYAVRYLSGFIDKKAKPQEIGLNILEDRFELRPTTSSEAWFEAVDIPYDKVIKFEIHTRNPSLPEEILALKDITIMQSDNNIEIEFRNEKGKKRILRLQMLTGITPIGQAVKCKELVDILNSEEVYDKFIKSGDEPVVRKMPQQTDLIEQIKKLNELKEIGALTEVEYDNKKKELLEKI